MLDFSVFNGFDFEFAPVGVKFEVRKPENLPILDKKITICQMLREAQLSDTGFYADYSCHSCQIGPYILGQIDGNPGMVSGQIGPYLGAYQDARANRQVYLDMKIMAKGTAPYTYFQRLDSISFDPDLVIITAKPSQAEVILRAKGYRNGSGWNAKGTPVAGCACLYTLPYLTGDLNMMVTGLHHGMKVRGVFPEGYLFLSIPFQILPDIVDNLKEMPWDLPQYHWGGEYHEKHMAEIGRKIAEEMSK